MLTTHQPNPPHYAIIQAAQLQPSTKIKYIRAINALIDARVNPKERKELTRYAAGLSHSSRAFLKSALKLLVKEQVTNLKASANPENIAQVQAALLNLEAMSETIQVKAPKGEKTHIWLSREQVEDITSRPDRTTLQGMRDYIVLAVLLGAGLRRQELEELTFDHIRQQPTKAGTLRDVFAITGKGGKLRTVPISGRLGENLRTWKATTGGGYIARSINKAGAMGESLSSIGIHNIVRKYGAMIGIPELDAHDLRRSYAMIGYNAGVPITQISVLLGHSNVATTQRYLNLKVDIETTASDHMPLSQ